MNKEDILKILEGAKDKNGDVPMRLVRQAFEKLPEPCTDTISRRVAIDAIEHIISSMSVCVNTDECHGMKRMQRQAVIELANLPSAQPEPCEDAVSRQDVIDAARKVYDIFEGEYDTRTPYGVVLDVQDAVSKLPSVTPKTEPQWIPVTERLPEEYGNYLISIHGEDEPDIGTINPNNKRGWSLCDASGFYWASDKSLIVTAWMPFPEPYKAESEE